MDKTSLKQLGYELWRLRCERNLLLRQVENRTGIPARIIESLELGRFLQYGFYRKLMEFYGKKMKIVLEWFLISVCI